MVSYMESTESPTPTQLLLDAERAAAAPFIDYPQVPILYPVGVGAWFTLLAASYAYQGAGRTSFSLMAICAAVGTLAFWANWYRKLWGTWPHMWQAPREIKQAYLTYLGLVAMSALIIIGTFVLGPTALALVVTFVLTAGVTWLYEKVIYPTAAARVRERLA